jgi:hypothetical protein
VEIDIVAIARDSITSLASSNNTDQSLRLVVHEQQSQNAPFIDATRPNQMSFQWTSAYQIQLMDTRHINSQSMAVHTIVVDSTPYH